MGHGEGEGGGGRGVLEAPRNLARWDHWPKEGRNRSEKEVVCRENGDLRFGQAKRDIRGRIEVGVDVSVRLTERSRNSAEMLRLSQPAKVSIIAYSPVFQGVQMVMSYDDEFRRSIVTRFCI